MTAARDEGESATVKPSQATLQIANPQAEPISFFDLRAQHARLRTQIDIRLTRVLEHAAFVLGPEVGEFERRLISYTGAAHAVTCANGTDALTIALMAEGIGPGDAVFLPSFTFTATAEAAALIGATPIFVEVDERTFLIDCDDLERRIAAVRASGELKPRAVIAVDLFGQPADFDRLNPLCAAEGLLLIADAAQSFGARYKDRVVGGLAPVSTTSFFPSKPLGCYGDGGALLTDDPERAAIYRSICGHGTGDDRYDVVRIGLNSRLDTLQAAVLLVKLNVVDEDRANRAALARAYGEALADVALTPHILEGRESAWAQYSIQLDNRDAVQAALKAKGVPTAIYYPRPMHLQKAYERWSEGPGSLPVSERLSSRVLALPMHADMRPEIRERIIAAVREAIAG
jgi:dTDP-4-amino-4,6-dideoxygalactose transaminase